MTPRLNPLLGTASQPPTGVSQSRTAITYTREVQLGVVATQDHEPDWLRRLKTTDMLSKSR